MLLSPHHFQQQAARFESLLQYQATAVSPFYWGVRQFKYDENALKGNLLSVIELEAIMPDGLAVIYDSQKDKDLKLNLKPYVELARGKTVSASRLMMIHLGCAVQPQQRINQAVDEQAALFLLLQTADGFVFVVTAQ